MSGDLRRLVSEGEAIDPGTYERAQAYRARLRKRIDSVLTDVDAIVSPTVPSLPPRDEPEWDDASFFGDMRWTVPSNLTGDPAVTIPLSSSAGPVGLQLVGRLGEDDALLEIAARVESMLNGVTDRRRVTWCVSNCRRRDHRWQRGRLRGGPRGLPERPGRAHRGDDVDRRAVTSQTVPPDEHRYIEWFGSSDSYRELRR